MQLLILLGIVVFIFLLFDLRGRVKRLEQHVYKERREESPARNEPIRTAATPEPASRSDGPSAFDRFAQWAKEDWLLKLGALLLLIGFGWLTSYAFINNWIGPMGRIALGIVAGALILILGFWRIQKYLHQGGVFLVLGSTVILLTLFAARTVYDFFTPTTALALMFLSTAFVGFASVKYNNRALALSSLILASVAPLLTHSPTQDYVGLFAYLFIVTLGAIWITVLTQRRELTAAALIIIALYSIPPIVSFYFPDRSTLLLFAYAFAALFFITNTAGLLTLDKKKMLPDLLTAGGNGAFLIVWVMNTAQTEWRSLILSAWMLIFVVGAFLLFHTTKKREPLYVYSAVGIALLAAATAAELQGAALTIAYSIEAGALSLLTYALLQDMRVAVRTSLLLIVPIILSLESFTSYAWTTGILHQDFFVLLILACVLLGLGTFYRFEKDEAKDAGTIQLTGVLMVLGSLYIYALIWLSFHAEFLADTAVMFSLAIYTVIGLITHLYGRSNDEKGLRVYGGVMLGFVVARLLLIDVWNMELSGRIITFFLVGALLISTAFVGRKKHSP